MKKKSKWSTLFLILIFIIGLSVMLYPAISTYWNERTQSQAIVRYESIMNELDEDKLSAMFDQAEQYNRKLCGLDFPLLDYRQIEGYHAALNMNETGMIGFLTIETLGLQLPIYHTTSNDVLGNAAGHLEGSSLPTGGIGNHCVISAHRGLPNATLFTNLDHMEVGHTFQITVLNRVLTYQVDQIKTVIPSDTTELQINPNEDYCTLLTCTPYGINTHRLLVRGKRVVNPNQAVLSVVSDAQQIDIMIVTPVVALPILLILMIVVLCRPIKKDDIGDELE
ncbi:MAG: class C sortase [Clostridia bacterium]|nr:class C sortase [Clostridia bacterium]